MSPDRATILSLTLAFVTVTSMIPLGGLEFVGTAAANHHDDGTFTLSQPGTNVCYEVEAFTHDHGKMVPEVRKRGSNDVGDVTGSYEDPDWDGPVTIESIMDYRYRGLDGTGQIADYAPYLNDQYRDEPWEDGTYGLYNWAENDHSHLFFYENADGEVSMVARHDRLYENIGISSHRPYNGIFGGIPGDGFFEPSPGGGSVSWEFVTEGDAVGLPDGEWAYLDDMYPKPGMSDEYVDAEGTRYGHRDAEFVADGPGAPVETFDGGYFSADWSWDAWNNSQGTVKHGTDGGAYRGFHNLESGERVTITNSFSGIEEWEVRTNDGTTNGEQLDLVMGEPLVIERGANCFDATLEAAPNPVEVDRNVTFTATGGGEEYRWDFDGDGAPEATTSTDTVSYAYDGAGEWQASVTVVEDGETTTASTTVEVGADQPPSAAFEVEDGEGDPQHHVVGESIRFDGSASSDNVGVAAYEWSIDGANATGERVNRTFSSTGDKQVSLTVTDRSGKTDTVNRTVTIVPEDDPESVATAAPEQVEADAPVTFDGTASGDEYGELVAYEWDLDGDGEIEETGPRVEWTYDDPGEQNVTFTVTDNNGNADVTNLSVSVTEPSDPVIESTEIPSEVSVSGAFSVAANATDAGTNPSELDYTWTFSGGGNATEKHGKAVTHEFDQLDTAAVELVVEDAAGRTNATSAEIAVTGVPSAALSADPAEVETGETVTLDAGNSTDDGTIARYEWDVDGDGAFEHNTTTNASVETTYDSAGSYDATVRVVDGDGSAANATATVDVESDERAQSGGGGGGGGGSVSLGPPPVLTETEQVGPNEAAIEVRNARGDETIESDLPASAVADDTGVEFRTVAVNLGSDDARLVVRTVASATPPEGVPALGDATGADATGTNATSPDETLAYLDLDAEYVDSGVENATVTVAVERSALGEYADPADLRAYGYDGSWSELDAEVVGSSEDAYRLAATVEGPGTLAVGATEGFAVTDVELAADSVTTGERFAANATVENGGSTARSATVNLTLSGSVVGSETVELGADETETLTLSGTAPTPGDYEVVVGNRSAGTLAVAEPDPADLSVTDVSLNASTIEAGESVEIRATVENAGDETGERTVALTMFGERLATETVAVAGGETERVSFVRAVEAAGSYEVAVGDATATLDVESTGGVDDVVPETPGIPGFGVGAAVAALLAALVVARARR